MTGEAPENPLGASDNDGRAATVTPLPKGKVGTNLTRSRYVYVLLHGSRAPMNSVSIGSNLAEKNLVPQVCP